MSEYWLYDENPFCVNAKSPIIHTLPNEAFFNCKIGKVWNKDYDKYDIGYSAIGRLHGAVSETGAEVGGEPISYLLVDSDGYTRLNFNDQQVLGASSLRLRAGKGYDTEDEALLDITLTWDTSVGGSYTLYEIAFYLGMKKLVGAVVPVRITVS